MILSHRNPVPVFQKRGRILTAKYHSIETSLLRSARGISDENKYNVEKRGNLT
jgi:hypothetical protein